MSLSESVKTIFPFAVKTRTFPQTGLVERAIGVFRAWQKQARDRAQLATMGDRTLRDIGFDRATVELEAARSFWQRPSDTWQGHGTARRRVHGD